MNRQQLLKLAQQAIDERRFKAEENRDRKLDFLRKDAEYKSCESNLRRAQVNGNKETAAKYKIRLLEILDSYNMTENDLQPEYTCSHCNDTGRINGLMCSCVQQELCKLITAESNVRNNNFTFENSSETNKHNIAVYKQARKICEEGTGNLLLTGNTGSGKTYLLSACVNNVIGQNKSVLLTTAYSLNTMFLDAHLSDFKTSQSILDTLTDVDVLAIDDLGTEISYKNVTAEYLFAVINERMASKKQTFISTNLSLANLRDRYDERLFSRLVDTNITTIAQLEGADKRLKK